MKPYLWQAVVHDVARLAMAGQRLRFPGQSRYGGQGHWGSAQEMDARREKVKESRCIP